MQNPVVRGLSPDPSACRVGDDYFLATSTLEFWPGIPIRHSTDLVHWTVISHAVTRPAQYRRDHQPGPLKLYAPTLRHHEGRFSLACTNMAAGQGNFIVTAPDPAGPWSDAVWIDGGAFDPSLTFDDDRVYYTRRTVISGQEGSGPVIQAEIDVDTGTLASEPRAITPGEAGYCSNDIEGPHLFHIDDWWYLVAAEGGTWKGHMVTVGRARSPWGPFEGCPNNPVLTHRHRVGHPIQSTGHLDLIDDAHGRWWALFHGTRHLGPTSWHHLGRETLLAPVTWTDDGWPVVGDAGTVEPTTRFSQPLPARGPARPDRRDAWTSGWYTREAPLPGVEIVESSPGTWGVKLPACERTLDDGGALAALFHSQAEIAAVFEVTLAAAPPAPATAGVAVYASPNHHYDLVVSTEGDRRRIVLRKRVGDLTEVSPPVIVVGHGATVLRITSADDTYAFAVRSAETEHDWTEVGTGMARLISAEASATYSGARFTVLGHEAPAEFPAASIHYLRP